MERLPYLKKGKLNGAVKKRKHLGREGLKTTKVLNKRRALLSHAPSGDLFAGGKRGKVPKRGRRGTSSRKRELRRGRFVNPRRTHLKKKKFEKVSKERNRFRRPGRGIKGRQSSPAMSDVERRAGEAELHTIIGKRGKRKERVEKL